MATFGPFEFIVWTLISAADPMRWLPLVIAAFRVRTLRSAIAVTAIVAVLVEALRWGLMTLDRTGIVTSTEASPAVVLTTGLMDTVLAALLIFGVGFALKARKGQSNG